MDKRIRRNEICVIGLPRCDFVFSSTRTCFIAYGFRQSTLEMTILRNLLMGKGIQPMEAGGEIAPAQNAFCAKICSKIITSQFCIILLNNEVQNGHEIANANVFMEYGLMLGFNKYVIPFQKAEQTLPFNVAGLDTIKYSDQDVERLASKAIDQAIEVTRQEVAPAIPADQVIEAFLLTKKALFTPLNTEGDKNLFQLGIPLGFYLLNDFKGLTYMFFGNFTSLRPESVLWRLRILQEIIDGRRSTFPTRIKLGLGTEDQVRIIEQVLDNMQIWVIVTSEQDKNVVLKALQDVPMKYMTEVFCLEDIKSVKEKLELPPA